MLLFRDQVQMNFKAYHIYLWGGEGMGGRGVAHQELHI